MRTANRHVEYWVPDGDSHSLVFGGGPFDTASRFGATSLELHGVRGAGSSGRSWCACTPAIGTGVGSEAQTGLVAKVAVVRSLVGIAMRSDGRLGACIAPSPL